MPPKAAAAPAAAPALARQMTAGANALQGTGGTPLDGMSADPMDDGATKRIGPTGGLFTVTESSLVKFLFPDRLEHPESTGRLELYGAYGPTDNEGRLRGGIGGAHVHTDTEIRNMISHNTREMLFELFKKPRADVEVIVDALMPLALAHHYTPAEVKRLLKDAAKDETGRMNFSSMQDIILASQRKRLESLRKNGPVVKDHAPKVPFQSKSAHQLLAITRRPKLNQQEEQLNIAKRLSTFSTCIAGLEDQNLTRQLTSNVMLLRNDGGYHGSVDDRWDRYCALRKTGKSSYVKARNEARFNPSMDCGTADKHNNVSSLVSTSYHPLTRGHGH